MNYLAESFWKQHKGFKIWKNPLEGEPSVTYMGEFYPPDGQFNFFWTDLVALGFGPGRYTILAPPVGPYESLLNKWQTVVVPND